MTQNLSLTHFLAKIRAGEIPAFQETLTVIEQHYHHQPTAFDNGEVRNNAASNPGSCKLFSFARLHGLDEQQTLNLFGEHYRRVLEAPDGNDHANIRSFMIHGWAGIAFHGTALTAKTEPN